VDDYRRGLERYADLPFGCQRRLALWFGVPLMFAGEVVGVLLVIEGRQGRLFNRDEYAPARTVGPQAAVGYHQQPSV